VTAATARVQRVACHTQAESRQAPGEAAAPPV